MSAWIVSYNHINSLVHWGVINGVFTENPNLVGQLLWDENVNSVNYRYEEESEKETFVYNPKEAIELSHIEVIKNCECLDYQSCEHPEWEDSLAKKYLDNILNLAISYLPKCMRDNYDCHPDYDQASWGIG